MPDRAILIKAVTFKGFQISKLSWISEASSSILICYPRQLSYLKPAPSKELPDFVFSHLIEAVIPYSSAMEVHNSGGDGGGLLLSRRSLLLENRRLHGQILSKMKSLACLYKKLNYQKKHSSMNAAPPPYVLYDDVIFNGTDFIGLDGSQAQHALVQ